MKRNEVSSSPSVWYVWYRPSRVDPLYFPAHMLPYDYSIHTIVDDQQVDDGHQIFRCIKRSPFLDRKRPFPLVLITTDTIEYRIKYNFIPHSKQRKILVS